MRSRGDPTYRRIVQTLQYSHCGCVLCFEFKQKSKQIKQTDCCLRFWSYFCACKMGPRKSLNFLTLKRTKSVAKSSENDFLHSVADFRSRITKRKSTGSSKTSRVSWINICDFEAPARPLSKIRFVVVLQPV